MLFVEYEIQNPITNLKTILGWCDKEIILFGWE